MFSIIAMAQEGAEQPSFFQAFGLPLIFVFVIFYFLLIRPQQRRFKRHQEFLGQLKRGDQVLTASGIFGRVEGITDQYVTLEVSEDVRIRILKSQVSSLANNQEEKK